MVAMLHKSLWQLGLTTVSLLGHLYTASRQPNSRACVTVTLLQGCEERGVVCNMRTLAGSRHYATAECSNATRYTHARSTWQPGTIFQYAVVNMCCSVTVRIHALTNVLLKQALNMPLVHHTAAQCVHRVCLQARLVSSPWLKTAGQTCRSYI